MKYILRRHPGTCWITGVRRPWPGHQFGPDLIDTRIDGRPAGAIVFMPALWRLDLSKGPALAVGGSTGHRRGSDR